MLHLKQWWLTLMDYNLFIEPAKCNQFWYLQIPRVLPSGTRGIRNKQNLSWHIIWLLCKDSELVTSSHVSYMSASFRIVFEKAPNKILLSAGWQHRWFGGHAVGTTTHNLIGATGTCCVCCCVCCCCILFQPSCNHLKLLSLFFLSSQLLLPFTRCGLFGGGLLG